MNIMGTEYTDIIGFVVGSMLILVGWTALIIKKEYDDEGKE